MYMYTPSVLYLYLRLFQSSAREFSYAVFIAHMGNRLYDVLGTRACMFKDISWFPFMILCS